MLAKARTRDSEQAMRKLTTVVDGHTQIVSDPPTMVPIEQLLGENESDQIYDLLRTVFGKYRRSLQSDRRRLLEQFELIQAARKVVGVGSVGQRAWVLLLEDDDLEPHVPASQAGAAVRAG